MVKSFKKGDIVALTDIFTAMLYEVRSDSELFGGGCKLVCRAENREDRKVQGQQEFVAGRIYRIGDLPIGSAVHGTLARPNVIAAKGTAGQRPSYFSAWAPSVSHDWVEYAHKGYDDAGLEVTLVSLPAVDVKPAAPKTINVDIQAARPWEAHPDFMSRDEFRKLIRSTIRNELCLDVSNGQLGLSFVGDTAADSVDAVDCSEILKAAVGG
jgi:hypothetical protein